MSTQSEQGGENRNNATANRNRNNPKADWEERNSNIGLVINFVIVFVGVIGSGLVFWQIMLTRDALGVAREANELNRKQFVNTNRAWVHFIDAKLIGDLEGPMHLEITLENSGNIPANDIVVELNRTISNPERIDKGEAIWPIGILPGGRQKIGAELPPIHPNIVKGINDGSMGMTITGKLRFTDEYGDQSGHLFMQYWDRESKSLTNAFVTISEAGEGEE